MWSNWVTFVIGIWLFISSFIPSLQGEANMVISGILAVIFGFIAARTWQGIINGVLGIWIFLTGVWFLLDVPVNYFVVGIIMTILGFWGGFPQSHQDMAHRTA